MRKLTRMAVIGGVGLLALTACGKSGEPSQKLVVAATAVPHAEILEVGDECRHVQRVVHGVSGRGVCGLELQNPLRGK